MAFAAVPKFTIRPPRQRIAIDSQCTTVPSRPERKPKAMMIAELIFSVILFIGALLHIYGSFLSFPAGSPELVWSVGSSGFAILLSVLAALRARRRTDRALSIIVGTGCIGWVAVVLAFGMAIGNPADPRVLYHVIVGVLLAAFAVRGIVAGR